MHYDLLVQNVNLVPMPGNRVMRGVDVFIVGNKIKSINPHESSIDEDNVVDGFGKYLIPGLFDMHTHVHSESFYPLFLKNGITTVREVGNDNDDIYERKNEVNTGEVMGPRMYIAGPILEGDPPAWPGFRVLKDAEDAKAAVRELKDKGVDFIKVYDTLQEAELRAVLQEAREQDLLVTGHVPDAIDVPTAIELGQVGYEHIYGFINIVGEINTDIYEEDENYLEFTSVQINKSRMNAVLNAMKDKDIYICPTLVLGEMMSRLSDYEQLKRETEHETAYLSDYYKDIDWNPAHADSSANINGMKPIFFKNFSKIHEASKQLLQPLVAVSTILAGSDTPNPFVVPGSSLLRELELLVESGFEPHQALEAATCNCAKFFGIENDFGTLDDDKIANAVLLNENPLEDISAVRDISGTVLNGKFYSREYLEEMANEAKQEYKSE